jgi:transposase InsO family protein
MARAHDGTEIRVAGLPQRLVEAFAIQAGLLRNPTHAACTCNNAKRAIGIRDKPIAPASSWQNGFAERLIGLIRRESVDHMIVVGEGHLRRNVKSYARYYNGVRMHRSSNKDAPISLAR